MDHSYDGDVGWGIMSCWTNVDDHDGSGATTWIAINNKHLRTSGAILWWKRQTRRAIYERYTPPNLADDAAGSAKKRPRHEGAHGALHDWNPQRQSTQTVAPPPSRWVPRNPRADG